MLGLSTVDAELLDAVERSIRSMGLKRARRRLEELNRHLWSYIGLTTINLAVDGIAMAQKDTEKATDFVCDAAERTGLVVVEALRRAAKVEATQQKLRSPDPAKRRPAQRVQFYHTLTGRRRKGQAAEIWLDIRDAQSRVHRFSLQPRQLAAVRKGLEEVIRRHRVSTKGIRAAADDQPGQPAVSKGDLVYVAPSAHCLPPAPAAMKYRERQSPTDRLVSVRSLRDAFRAATRGTPAQALDELRCFEPELASYIQFAVSQLVKNMTSAGAPPVAAGAFEEPLLRTFLLIVHALRSEYAQLWEGTEVGEQLTQWAEAMKQLKHKGGRDKQ